MKKIIVLILVVFLFSACSEKNKGEGTVTTKLAIEPTEKPNSDVRMFELEIAEPNGVSETDTNANPDVREVHIECTLTINLTIEVRAAEPDTGTYTSRYVKGD